MEQVTSATLILEKLKEACKGCKRASDEAEQRQSMLEAYDAGHVPQQRTVTPSSSFSAVPNKR